MEGVRRDLPKQVSVPVLMLSFLSTSSQPYFSLWYFSFVSPGLGSFFGVGEGRGMSPILLVIFGRQPSHDDGGLHQRHTVCH